MAQVETRYSTFQDIDANIVASAQTGDMIAQGKIYKTYLPAISRYMSGRVRPACAAEDVTQDALIRVIDKIDQYHDIGKPFGSWVFSVARTTFLDYHRAAKLREAIEIPDQQQAQLSTEEEALSRLQIDEVLQRLSSRTTKKQQTVFMLRIMAGLSQKETANLLETSENAIKTHLSKARAKIKGA